jgi:hypothetical protein
MNEKNLFIFIDESGNFDFSPSGTKYFVLTSIATFLPLKDREKFWLLRYKLLLDGVDQECFHATEDQQIVRNGIYSLINKLDDFRIDVVIAQKNKTNKSLYLETYNKKGEIITRVIGAEFYRIICQTLLQYIFRRCETLKIERIIVVLDALFTKNKRQIILKSLKSYLKQNFKKQFNIYFHQAKADVNCQIADYCGWAVYVKNERKELRPYQEISKKVKSEFSIFERGTIEYYPYK